MAYVPYRQQILSPHWQKRRLEIMQRDGFTCQRCSNPDETLHVHHKQYIKGRMAWEYEDRDLVTLCHSCHESMPELETQTKNLIAALPLDGPACLPNALGLLAGWACWEQGVDADRYLEEQPFHFVLGRVVRELDIKLNIDHLMGLSDALDDCPRWVVMACAEEFVRALNARRFEPAPPGFGEFTL